MRRLLPLAALAAVLALAPNAGAGTLFVLTGRGWGHGVGMSQWGAFGLAKQGGTYKEILRHYYSGTSVGERTVGRVGVELTSGRTSVVVGSSAPFRVSAGTRSVVHAAGSATVTKTATGRIKVEGLPRTFASPATFASTAPSTDPIKLGSRRYRGTLVVNVASGLRVVNRLGMELYVRGVVPNESPASWPAAALKAQAVAARSYALFARLRGGGKCGGAFCSDTRDQVYRGLDSEQPSTNAAATATAREAVLDAGGDVAQTFFHSSSGGRTASSADTWGGTLSYLKSVADPADLVPENPRRFWRVLRTAPALRRQLGLARTPNDATAGRNSSDRVASITASGPGWTTVVPGGDSLRWRLGIDSNRFWLGVLRLTASDRRIEWGQGSTLSAFVRGVPGSVLKRRRYGGTWEKMQAVRGGASVAVAPRITTSYRLGTPVVTGVTVRVSVGPRLRFNQEQSAGSLAGIMRPKLAGTTVAIQRLASGAWKRVATATVRADGTWKAVFKVGRGTYRAYGAPGKGYVAGASPTLKIVTR